MENEQYIISRLNDIWDNHENLDLSESVLWSRRYWFPINEGQSDILITGINPSYKPGEDNPKPRRVTDLLSLSNKYHPYWTALRRIVYEDRPERRIIEHLDFRQKTSVMDLFYFREKDQNYLKNTILKKWSKQESINFIINQLQITQERIEQSIKPKIIIVKNKESQAYWGKLNSPEHECIWMGYQFKDIPYKNDNWTLSRVVGINQNNISGIKSSVLVKNHTLVLFVPHINQYTSINERPTPEIIADLLEMQSSLKD